MATTTQPQAPRRHFPRPSGKAVLAILGAIVIVWAALGIQAAILSDRQAASSTDLQQQINAIKAGGAQAAPTSFPVAISDQAAAHPYDAALAPASPDPVKEITLTATDDTVIGIAKGIDFHGWSFGNSIPAQPLHVRQGDTIKFTLVNKGTMGHSVDFHAAQIDPAQNYKVVLPGQSLSFTWTADQPGVFMFHCGAAPVIEHLASGMYGAIVVDPTTPLPPAREYVLVQSEYYLKQQGDSYVTDVNKALAATPDYVVFNGMVNQYRQNPLTANPGELIRLYVVNAGPSETSAFHVIGAIFSAVYPDGNLANKLTGVSTYNIAPGGAAMFELTIPSQGTYPFVTHDFADASKGAIGAIQVGPAAANAAAVHDMTGSAVTTGSNQAAAAATLTLTATDNAFSQKTITVKAGQAVTVTLTNKGQAVHNFHVLGLKGADGKDVQTALVESSGSASVTFTPQKAGSYTFQCDVHPSEMTGTLIVQ